MSIKIRSEMTWVPDDFTVGVLAEPGEVTEGITATVHESVDLVAGDGSKATLTLARPAKVTVVGVPPIAAI